MSTTVKGKSVLVTGSNRGIGKALVAEALARGASKVYAGTRQDYTHEDPRVETIPLDVTSADQIAAAASAIGDLDVLINNAGIMLPDDPSIPNGLDQQLQVNALGPRALTEALLPKLVESNGAVINMLSCVALAPLPMFSGYAASKAAAFALTKSFRMMNAPQGVRFHAVLAGPIDTEMTQMLQIPKASPADAAAAIFDAAEQGAEEIFPDPSTSQLGGLWESGADKVLEKQFSQLVSQPS